MGVFPPSSSHALDLQRSADRAGARQRRRNTLTALALVIPAGFFYFTFQLAPVGFAFVLSFFDWNGINLADARFIGLDNFRRMAEDELLWQALWHNVLIAVAIVVLMCGGSFLVAAVLHSGMRGGSAFRVIFFAPMAISSVAVGILAVFIFSPSQGLLNSLLESIGLESLTRPWLGDKFWALPTVTITYILQTFGFSVVLFTSALGQVPSSVLEAAEMDGAPQGTILRRIVLPIIKPIASVVVLLGIVTAFRFFDTVFMMTGGGPFHASDTMVTYLYNVSFLGNEVGYGNAIGLLIFGVLLVIAVVQLRVTRSDAEKEIR